MSEPQDLIAAFYRHYNAHDVEAVGLTYVEDGVHEDIASAKRAQGRDAVEAGLRGFFAMLPDVVFHLENTVLSRNSAVVFYRMKGHIGKDFGSLQTKGKPIDLPGVHVFSFDGEHIRATTDFWDEAVFKAQLTG
jgi:steroid delta-isomerase-like uncharacterized protein